MSPPRGADENTAPLRSEVPVLIVGAGPTGLLAANLLGTYAIECLLVERNATTSALPKAILLDDEGLRALQAASLADEVCGHIIAGYGARYYAADGTCFAKVDSPVTEHGYARRNAFLQPDLERIMAAGVARFDHVETRFETRLVGLEEGGGHIKARLVDSSGRTATVRCRFLLGCDGARSTVRGALAIAMQGRTYSRDWVVADTLNDPDCDRFSKFFCDPARPLVSIPAPGGGRRYEYMVMPGEDRESAARIANVKRILSRFRDIPDEDFARAVVYTFEARVAERLSQGRAVLLGDAAHLTPPFAGQGMNAGLRDAFNIAWKVALALRGIAPPEIVRTYETERRRPIEEMIDYAVGLGEIVMPSGGAKIRKGEIAAALAGSPGGGEGVSNLAAKPQACYAGGWLAGAAPGALVGHPLAQPWTADAVRLDDVLGPGFALIAFDQAGADALVDDTHDVWARLGVRKIVLTGEAGPASTGALPHAVLRNQDLIDTDALGGQVLLVRPDRFIAAQGPATELAALAGRIEKLL